jgi:glycosyltransferase involved in cell wall biosynthesis
MKIALNATIASPQQTGTGVYAANLTSALMQLQPDHEFVIYCCNDMVDWFQERRNGHASTVKGIDFKSPSQRIFWEQTQLRGDLKRQRVDLLHSMAFTSPVVNSVRSVVTVHDLAFVDFPETLPLAKRLYYKPIFQRSLRKANRVITPSETVRKQVIEAFGVQSGTVFATPLAVDAEFRGANSDIRSHERIAKYGVSQPYLLAVGTLDPRKNLFLLLKAYDLLKRNSNLKHQLVIVGKRGWQDVQQDELAKRWKQSNDIVFTGYVAQADMPHLYAGADLFLFPSLYEGFGLPLLEAMAAGAPVLASDIAVHREVCAEAALFANPRSAEEWQSTILRILQNTPMIDNIRQKGWERVKHFSWQKTAELTLKAYEMEDVR